ncbi:MAG TPA: hypothetical protein VMT53_13390 [Terriglobales bacterium]|nr:hypothetical protein [Terriglobales bacterium]
MATKKTGRSLADAKAKLKPVSEPKPVALTVKVDNKTYVRLCTFGATQRRTNQDILREAVQEYLDRVGA